MISMLRPVFLRQGLVARHPFPCRSNNNPLYKAASVHTEAKLAEMGLKLPPPGVPKGNFAMAVRSGKMIYLSGHLPTDADGKLITGKVGAEVTPEDAQKAAKLIALNLLSSLKKEIGDLDKVQRVIKLLGFVNCTDGFTQQPLVINGASDFLVQVLGETKGKHARSAVGTNALPLNVPVEIEMIVELQ
ncbi:endoribonuclease l-psp [Nannochloropsis oceanica]